MAAETGRRASRLELIRARLHESGRRGARDCDVTAATPTTAVDHDVRPSPQTGRQTTYATHNGIRPVSRRPVDPDHRSSRDDARPDRKVLSGNTNHDRRVPVGRHTEVRGRAKLDASTERPQYTQVRKPAATSSLPADRGQTGVEDTGHLLTPGHDDSTTSRPRRLAQKTSSSSSLLSKSQNFFARLRSRKNDPSKSTKSVCMDSGSGNDSGSRTKIRRSISESGCAVYANRDELVTNSVNIVDMSPRSAHRDAEQETGSVVGGPEAVDGIAVAESMSDHATTISVYAEVEPSTSHVSTDPDVTQPTESTSGSGQDDSCLMPTTVYEECAGSYSLREALLRRGGEAAATETATSMTSSHIIRRESAPSSSQSDADHVPPRKSQTTSLLPVGGAVSGGCRSMSLASWRRRKLATTHSSGCVMGGRRDGHLERIAEVDSPPGSADDDVMSLRPPCSANSVAIEQSATSSATQRGSDARNCKFTA